MLTTTTNIDLEKERKARIFEKEFYPLADALYNFGYTLTHSDAEAKDLVQDTYLKAHRFSNSYQEGTNAKAWLFRILKNAFINKYRKKSNNHEVGFEEAISYHREEGGALTGYVDMRVDVFENIIGDEVTNAINGLSVEFRTVILLSDVEGFSYEEISKIVDIPIGTVRSRLFRGRKRLKAELKEYAQSLGYKDKHNS